MGRALALREDYDAVGLRGLARTTRHAGQARRLLALAAIYDAASRGDAARLAGTDRPENEADPTVGKTGHPAPRRC